MSMPTVSRLAEAAIELSLSGWLNDKRQDLLPLFGDPGFVPFCRETLQTTPDFLADPIVWA